MSKVENITEAQKQDIIRLINDAALVFGSMSEVATKCNVSPATISLMVKNEYMTKGDEMWRKIGAKLGYRPSGWVIANTTRNVKAGMELLTDAQEQSLFLRISDKAGKGKSTLITAFMAANKSANVFYIKCRDWGKRELLVQLHATLNIQISGHKTQDNLLENIINFFTTRKGKPLLIMDQANSLKPASLGFLIHLFNECEDKLGVVIAGTSNLRVNFERGVKYNRNGYDELDSRFARSFITLPGNSLADTRRICEANGIDDKSVQETIFKACNPVSHTVPDGDQHRSVNIVEDGRLIKRQIIKHHLLTAINQN